MLPWLWLLVGSKGPTDRQTMSVIELSWTAKNLSMGKQCFSVNLINCNSDFCCSYSAISRCDHFGKCWCYSRWIWKDRSCVTLIKLESKPWTLCFLWTIKLLDILNTKFQFLCLFELIAQFDVSTLIDSKACYGLLSESVEKRFLDWSCS